MILIIDNYDSFVHNLARYVVLLGQEVQVVRNDAIGLDQIEALAPAALVLSPGPCTPNEAGICLDAVRRFGPSIPILGVCLGHQAIAQALGGAIVPAARPRHGQSSEITHTGQGLFQGLPSPMAVGRYHSLVVRPEDLPEDLLIDAQTADGVVMAIRHRQFPLFGVQFHPESILTQHGTPLLQNFLRCAGLQRPAASSQDELPPPQPTFGTVSRC